MSTCKDCIYSHMDEAGVVTCRKNPPVIVVVRYRPDMNYNATDDRVISAFPKVTENTWCGHWAENKE